MCDVHLTSLLSSPPLSLFDLVLVSFAEVHGFCKCTALTAVDTLQNCILF